ncbi:MAG: hypothetical protein R3288_03325 [Woeseiaceae bacterium]|nr:hypothetical protein [Woeseiaceae bacterium]
MLKTFITGIVFGIAGVIAALYYVPVVNQHREVSVIAVTPNGGNAESFHVNVPMDRILIGDSSSNVELPAGLQWPADARFENSRAEVFKLRNSRNAVVGIATRLAANNRSIGNVIEWVLHLPARGSLYVTLDPQAADGGRSGDMRAGTREFADLVGNVSERWVRDTSGLDDAPVGRIELTATFVARMHDDDYPGDDE